MAICIPYILLTVVLCEIIYEMFHILLCITLVLCITLEPNGKLSGYFVWLDMGLPNTENESNTLNESLRHGVY